MKQLNRTVLSELDSTAISVPPANYLDLPERVLQFGTGVLLRGLPDYYIDKANKAGVFNGRIVVVKSTDRGNDGELFQQQDMLFTQCVRGFKNGAAVEEITVNASISRILSAKLQWNEILACAENSDIQIIISNTTEAGLQVSAEDKLANLPPTSFPAKLLAVLYRRYTASNGNLSQGFVILPTELVTNNGNILKGLVLQLASQFNMEAAFVAWIENANYFCNTLVDRIVPGKMTNTQHALVEQQLGYHDPLMIMSETYSLWAIEYNNPIVPDLLSFAKVNPEIILAKDITKYREHKLRLLNGTHTFVCGLAILLGFETVKEAMTDQAFFQFIKKIMREEIVPCIAKTEKERVEAFQFADDVLDRFRNPFLDHKWQSISFQYTEKMKMRNVPLLQWHRSYSAAVPERMAFGFAAYLVFTRCILNDADYSGKCDPISWKAEDKHMDHLSQIWQNNNLEQAVDKLLADITLWGVSLGDWQAFKQRVQFYVNHLLQNGARESIAVVNAQGTLKSAHA